MELSLHICENKEVFRKVVFKFDIDSLTLFSQSEKPKRKKKRLLLGKSCIYY